MNSTTTSVYSNMPQPLYAPEVNGKMMELAKPFPPEKIHWRVGSMSKDKTKGLALAYLDARDVMQRLDEVMFIDWQCRYTLAADGLLICEIGLKLETEWIWRANGAGDTHVEAEKGKASDAFKRAAVLWGVGRYLYSVPSPWVEVNQYKQIANPQALTERLRAWQEKVYG